MNLDLSQYSTQRLLKIRHAFMVASVYDEFNVNDPIIKLIDDLIKSRDDQPKNSIFDLFKQIKLG